MAKNAVSIYTDGSCAGCPGIGGWAAILEYKNTERIVSGNKCDVTSSEMELTAIVEAFKILKKSCNVTVYTDSQMIADAVSKGTIQRWKAHGWRRVTNKPLSFAYLWQELDQELSKHNVKFEWVKGHAGHPYNERCDSIAKDEIVKYVSEKEHVPENQPKTESQQKTFNTLAKPARKPRTLVYDMYDTVFIIDRYDEEYMRSKASPISDRIINMARQCIITKIEITDRTDQGIKYYVQPTSLTEVEKNAQDLHWKKAWTIKELYPDLQEANSVLRALDMA